MHEKDKLKEAEYFFKQMKNERENGEHFKFNLSAFLSATRSALQFAQEEAKQTEDGKLWFGNSTKNNEILRFFGKKRNINIHKKPITPVNRYQIDLTGTKYAFAPDNKKLKDGEGNVTLVIANDTNSLNKNQHKPSRPEIKLIGYFFNDWHADEDVITLCRKYFGEIKNIIEEGISHNFITG